MWDIDKPPLSEYKNATVNMSDDGLTLNSINIKLSNVSKLLSYIQDDIKDIRELIERLSNEEREYYVKK